MEGTYAFLQGCSSSNLKSLGQIFTILHSKTFFPVLKRRIRPIRTRISTTKSNFEKQKNVPLEVIQKNLHAKFQLSTLATAKLHRVYGKKKGQSRRFCEYYSGKPFGFSTKSFSELNAPGRLFGPKN